MGLKHTVAAQYPLTETDAMSSNQDECSVFTFIKDEAIASSFA
ncbi:hypothetical protein OGM63_17490 [Plectonema radiosum NIES-515]|uniref:Uncharacterized protein n=1 Tax=Plectonema radiosum NIES-515 TaxID=2986073 RepID=A0ABT3B1Q4_9CYAN|nr:hypothetical protein [Plectonema radiosum]MCV3215282.1 hypothetical protein [Plectonema radiosum NIES-515]